MVRRILTTGWKGGLYIDPTADQFNDHMIFAGKDLPPSIEGIRRSALFSGRATAEAFSSKVSIILPKVRTGAFVHDLECNGSTQTMPWPEY